MEATAIVGSPSTANIYNVPQQIGAWDILKVFIQVSYPNGSTVIEEAVKTAQGIWTATVPMCEMSGRVKSGFTVIADGEDENGDEITGYILGVADFAVYTRGLVVRDGETTYNLRYFDTPPEVPAKGDVAPFNGIPKLYDGYNWISFADDVDLSDYYTKEETDELFDDYYTKDETDAAIDALAAYYITYTAAGAAFPTRADLLGASTYYSGGVARTPTRNDYAVVLADEEHGGAEYRYIYGVAEGATEGQWEAQYPIETNDYTALSNKPKINNVELSGNKTAANLGLATSEQGAAADAALPKSDVVAPLNTATAGKAADARATGEALTALSFSDWYPNGSVTSVADFTSGIKYDFDDSTGTAAVRPFFNTGNLANDNSNLAGRVVIPPYVDYNGRRYAVTSIANAFGSDRYNTVLTDIVAPATLTTIGGSAIYNCTALKSVYFPGVTSTGSYALGGSSVEDVQMPKLQTTANNAFYNCTALKKISLPSLVSVGTYAFGGTPLEEVSMPKRTGFAMSEFYNCGSLKKVYSPAITNLPYTVFESCGSLEVIDFGNELTTVPTLASTTFNNARPCIIVVPDALYNDWIAALYWTTLPSRGFRFVKHSDWNFAHKYELADLQQSVANVAASVRYDLANTSVNEWDVRIDTTDPNNPINYSQVSLPDRTAKTISILASIDELRLVFPAAVSGKVRDFYARVEVGDGTSAMTAPAIVPVAPTGETIAIETADGTMPTLADGSADSKGVALLYFTETSPGKFLVKGEAITEVA